MTHELAGALQEARRIRQGCAVEESHIDVGSEYIDVAEGRIAQIGNWTVVMYKLSNFVAAISHLLKPPLRDGPYSPARVFIHTSTAGSFSTAPLSRSSVLLGNFVRIVISRSAFEIDGYLANSSFSPRTE